MADRKKPTWDYLFKIVLTGDNGIGKCSLSRRWCENEFSNSPSAYVGWDFRIKFLSVESHQVKAQIWDGRTEKFSSFTPPYRGASAIIAVFDVTSQQSFVNVAQYLNDFKHYTNEDCIFAVVGTKTDLDELREVSFDEAAEFCSRLGVQYFEVSSRTGNNVDNFFMTILQQCLAVAKRLETDKQGKLKLVDSKPSRRWTFSGRLKNRETTSVPATNGIAETAENEVDISQITVEQPYIVESEEESPFRKKIAWNVCGLSNKHYEKLVYCVQKTTLRRKYLNADWLRWDPLEYLTEPHCIVDLSEHHNTGHYRFLLRVRTAVNIGYTMNTHVLSTLQWSKWSVVLEIPLDTTTTLTHQEQQYGASAQSPHSPKRLSFSFGRTTAASSASASASTVSATAASSATSSITAASATGSATACAPQTTSPKRRSFGSFSIPITPLIKSLSFSSPIEEATSYSATHQPYAWSSPVLDRTRSISSAREFDAIDGNKTHPEWRPYWVADDTVSQCQTCNRAFSVTVRRHHCRSCGKCLCSSCCPAKPLMHLPQYGKEVRVCKLCQDTIGRGKVIHNARLIEKESDHTAQGLEYLRTIEHLEVFVEPGEEKHWTQGATAVIYKGTFYKKPVAIKQYKRGFLAFQQEEIRLKGRLIPGYFQLEKELHGITADCPYAVHALMLSLDALVEYPFVVTELHDKYGTLGGVLAQHHIPLSWKWRVRVLYQICSFLEHIHSRGYAHIDLKAENIVVLSLDDGDDVGFEAAKSVTSAGMVSPAIGSSGGMRKTAAAVGNDADCTAAAVGVVDGVDAAGAGGSSTNSSSTVIQSPKRGRVPKEGVLVKVFDFNSAQKFSHLNSDEMQQLCRTTSHTPPEYLSSTRQRSTEGYRIDGSFDMFSFGIVMGEVASRALHYREESMTASLVRLEDAIVNGERPLLNKDPDMSIVDSMPREYTSIANACWTSDRSNRSEAYVIVHELESLLASMK